MHAGRQARTHAGRHARRQAGRHAGKQVGMYGMCVYVCVYVGIKLCMCYIDLYSATHACSAQVAAGQLQGSKEFQGWLARNQALRLRAFQAYPRWVQHCSYPRRPAASNLFPAQQCRKTFLVGDPTGVFASWRANGMSCGTRRKLYPLCLA